MLRSVGELPRSKRGDHLKVPHRNRRGFSRLSLSASLLSLKFVAFPSPPVAKILSSRRVCFPCREHHQCPELVMEPCKASKRYLAQRAGDSLKPLEQSSARADRGMGPLDRFHQHVAQVAVARLGDFS